MTKTIIKDMLASEILLETDDYIYTRIDQDIILKGTIYNVKDIKTNLDDDKIIIGVYRVGVYVE